MSNYQSTYGVARFISKIFSFLGWLVVIIGSLGIVTSLSAGSYLSQRYANILFALMGPLATYFCLSGVVVGLLIIAGGQITRAVVDTADYNGEILSIIKGMAAQEKVVKEN